MAPFRVVIPARYASARLPGKALMPLAGKTMLQWVYERAQASGALEILIATEDARVLEAARAFGAEALMTSAAHASGTDRIAEVARRAGWPARDIVVNVQGDEPLIPPALIAQVAGLLAAHPDADIATLAAPLDSAEQLLNPHVVKVVTDAAGRALYFSRAPIPWNREGAVGGLASQREFALGQRHIGIYAYRVDALLEIAALPVGRLEACEKLEQLRALEQGFEIRVAAAAAQPGPDVNTREDLERVGRMLAGG